MKDDFFSIQNIIAYLLLAMFFSTVTVDAGKNLIFLTVYNPLLGIA